MPDRGDLAAWPLVLTVVGLRLCWRQHTVDPDAIWNGALRVPHPAAAARGPRQHEGPRDPTLSIKARVQIVAATPCRISIPAMNLRSSWVAIKLGRKQIKLIPAGAADEESVAA